MTEELEQKAEDFIIDRYKIAECYREDNAETREYMRNDVHSQYEEESQLYIAGAIEETKELKAQIEKMINEIDKTMVLSNMRECEICNIQDIFRKYGFKRNNNNTWEIKEND